MLKNFAYIDDDCFVVWTDDAYDGTKFREIKLMAKNRTLMLIDGVLLLWNFPSDIFTVFKEVYILTYMFDAQIQKYYYDINNIEINYIGVEKKNSIYKFSDKHYIPEYTKTLKNNINILEDSKLNQLGDTETALSVSWFERDKKKEKTINEKLKDNLINVFNNRFKSSSDDNMWTTYKNLNLIFPAKDILKVLSRLMQEQQIIIDIKNI